MYISELEENRIADVRALLYNIAKSFFKEPEEAMFRYWKEVFERLSTESVNTGFDSAVKGIRDALNENDIGEDFYRLFVDPYSDDHIELTVSMYFEGRNYSKTLVRVRDVLDRAGLERAEETGVPEDYIPFLFEAMEVLIRDGYNTVESQQEIFREFLFPVIPMLSKKLKNKGGVFYRAVGEFLEAFCRLEEDYLILTEKGS